MRQEKGFWHGIVLSSLKTLFVCAVVGFILYSSEFSFSFKGKEVLKPIWEVIVDKTVDVGSKIAKVII